MRGKKILAALLCVFLSLFLLGYVSISIFNAIVDEKLVRDVIKQKIKSEVSESAIEQMKLACEFGSISEIPIPADSGSVSISCSEIQSRTAEEIVDLISERVARAFFYRNITCSIPQCLKNSKTDALFSYKARIFFQKFEIPLLVLSGVCVLLVFVVLGSFSSGAKSAGTTLLLTALPLLFLDFFTERVLSEKLPHDFLFVKDIILARLSSLHALGFSIFAAGLVLLICGFAYQKFRKS